MKHIFLATAAAIALGAPAATAQTIGMAGIPSGFGVAGNVVALSFSGSYSQQLRGVVPNQTHWDAATSATFGFGNPVSGVGVEVGINLTSFRRFGQSDHLRATDQATGGLARPFAVTECHRTVLDRRDIAICLLQQALAARRKVEGQPRLAQLEPVHVDDVEIGEVTRRDDPAILKPI